jgi:hypothetical protein
VDKGLDAVADKLIEAAMEGDQWAMREIGDRVEGKPVQAIASDPDNPFKIQGVIDLVRPG